MELDRFVVMALLLLQERAKGPASNFYPYVCKVHALEPVFEADGLEACCAGG